MNIMKPFVLGFYGESDSGKTTLIVDILSRLKKEGCNVASVKISDKKISIDSEGKDTWKHASAGSNLVVFSTDCETDFLLKQKMGGTEIVDSINRFKRYDIIIIEGVNDESIPKIRIGKIKERKNTVITYNGDFEKLIEYIKKEINRRNEMEKISIKVNGKEILLTEFPTDIIKNAIVGMLKSLKGIEKIEDVEIRFKL